MIICTGPVQAMPDKIKISQPNGQNIEYNINDFIENPILFLNLANQMLAALQTDQRIIGVTSDNDVIDIKEAIKSSQGYNEYEQKVQEGQISQASDLVTHLLASVDTNGSVVLSTPTTTSVDAQKNFGQYIGCGYHVLKSGKVDSSHVITSNVVIKNKDLLNGGYISNIFDTSSDITDYIAQNAASMTNSINASAKASYKTGLVTSFSASIKTDFEKNSTTKKNLTMIKHRESHRNSYVSLTDLSDRGINKLTNQDYKDDIQELGNLINALANNTTLDSLEFDAPPTALSMEIPNESPIINATGDSCSFDTTNDSLTVSATNVSDASGVDDTFSATSADTIAADTTDDTLRVTAVSSTPDLAANDAESTTSPDVIRPDSSLRQICDASVESKLTTEDKLTVNAAIDRLFDRYGTHIIKGYQLGGRLEMNYLFANESRKDDYTLSVAVKASYRGISTTVTGEAKTKIEKDVEEMNKNSTLKFSTVGGDNITLTCSDVSDIKSTYQRWVDSIVNKPAMYNIPDLDQNLSGIWNYTGEPQDYSDPVNNPEQYGVVARLMCKRFMELADQAAVSLNGYDFSDSNYEDKNLIVTDIKVFTGSSREEALNKVPEGYTVVRINPEGRDRDELDANKGAGGKYIFIAYKRESKVSIPADNSDVASYTDNADVLGRAITDVALVNHCDLNKPPAGGFKPIAIDLNEGTGKQAIYLWIKRDKALSPIYDIAGYIGTNSIPDGWHSINTSVSISEDLNKYVSGSPYIWLVLKGTESKYCITDIYIAKGSSAAEASSNVKAGYQAVTCLNGSVLDCNSGAGGKYLYIAYKLEVYNDSTKNNAITNLATTSDGSYGDNKWKALGQDLNAGAGGSYVYLHYEKNPSNKKPLTDISGYYTESGRGTPPSGWEDINNSRDLNHGCDCDRKIYLLQKRLP